MVFVLNKNKDPLSPCHPAKARQLLKKGKAVIHKKYPFTIRLKEHKEVNKRKYKPKELWKINSIAHKAVIDVYPYVSGEFKPSECQTSRSSLCETGHDEQGREHKLL